MESQGREASDLTEVLRWGMHHNAPNSYHLEIIATTSSIECLEKCMDAVTGRAALVQRHMRDAQTALEEIYQVAKDKGYSEITEIFEREYNVGHGSSESTQE